MTNVLVIQNINNVASINETTQAVIVSQAGAQGIQGATGATGATGAQGIQGATGEGVPAGGTTGQVLAKVDNTDFNTEWVDQTGGGGGATDIDNLPNHAKTSICFWEPLLNSASFPTPIGFSNIITSGFSTVQQNFNATDFYNRKRRLALVTSANINSFGRFRPNAWNCSTGKDRLGGFLLSCEFAIADAATVENACMFIGVQNWTNLPNASPLALQNILGVGHEIGDTNLRIYAQGSSAQATVDLGANFPCNTLSTDWYRLIVFSPHTATTTTVKIKVINLRTGIESAVHEVASNDAAVLPQPTQALEAPSHYRGNNSTALAVRLAVGKTYLETEF